MVFLVLPTKVPFTFNGDTYMQIDGVMMGSPLGALFANIFMCELENTVIPQLGNIVCSWIRFVDDTFVFIKPDKVDMVKQRLNGFHKNIKFTHESEHNDALPFLDVLIRRSQNGELETSIYRKETNTDIYMNWYSYAPNTWKIATLKSLVKRAFLICLKPEYLQAELSHIKETFSEKNDYPIRLVEEIIKNERNLHHQQTKRPLPITEDEITNRKEEETDKPVSLSLNLPYAGIKGEQLITNLKNYVSKTVNKKKKIVSIHPVYRSKKLSSNFRIKDDIKFKHQHNIVYHAECPNKKCISKYTGETKCRIEKRADEHHGRDKKSQLHKHAVKTKHKRVNISSFEIIGKGYRSNFARKISESLFIKTLKPDLNVQKDSYKLKLFN